MTGKVGISGAWLVLVCLLSPVIAHADEVEKIRELIGTTFDRPEAVVISGPVVVEQDYAVADWTQGDHGGRALLRRQGGRWAMTLCAGESLRGTDGMLQAGVPSEVAILLSRRLSLAERDVPASRLQQFSRFRPGEDTPIPHHGHH